MGGDTRAGSTPATRISSQEATAADEAHNLVFPGSTPGPAILHAGVSELADEADSKSVARRGVWVQVPPPAFAVKGLFRFRRGRER